MKVLIIAPYIYNDAYKEFIKNKTGFGIMVREIVEAIAQKCETSLLTTQIITEGRDVNKYKIFPNNAKKIVLNLKPFYLYRGIKEFLFKEGTLIDKLRYLYINLNLGYVEKTIENDCPEVVNIHGLGYETSLIVEVCKKTNVKVLVTLHGLNGIETNIDSRVKECQKLFEKDFLRGSAKKSLPISVISTGVKNRINENYCKSDVSNIKVITNGTDIFKNQKAQYIDIYKKYLINKDKKIVVCIGNIIERKNQIQLIRMFKFLTKKSQENTVILFIGNDKNLKITEKIKESPYSNQFIFCGFVDNKLLHNYYSQAKLNVVVSKDEGFGLSTIEGFAYGLPTLTFSDLDAVPDLFNEKAMQLVYDRSDEALAKGIEVALNKEWDKEWIKEYSNKFSLEKMADNYIEYYSKIINNQDETFDFNKNRMQESKG